MKSAKKPISAPSPSITFIIGAGASNEVGIPTGHGLKAAIASALSFHVDDFRRIAGGDPVIRECFQQFAHLRGDFNFLNDYLHSSRLICSAMPQAPSIDNFIDSHRSNELIADVGKLAIAAEIIKAEQACKLFVDSRNTRNSIRFNAVEDTWFNAFFQLLTLNTQFNDIAKRLSAVRVITFNYDRTLEHYLHQALQNYYGCTSDEAAEALSHLEILHPYGQVGFLPWQKKPNITPVPFGGSIHSSGLISVAKTLRTFTEGTNAETSQVELIREAVSNASKLVFLGFGFHELNLEVLFGQGGNGTLRNGEVYGTAKGLSASNKAAIVSELASLGNFDPQRVMLHTELAAVNLFYEYSRSLKIV